jgi:anti-anti-sigma regulatory factor
MSEASQSARSVPNACPFCGADSGVDLSSPDAENPCPACGRLLWFVRKPVDQAVVFIFLPGLLSGSESLPRVDEVLSAAGGSARVAVDVSRLRVISSVFLGMLVSLQRKLVAAQRTLKIFGVTPGHREVFRATKLDTVFSLYGDEQSALASF